MTKKTQVITAEPMHNFMFLTCNKKQNVSKSGLITSAVEVIDIKQDVIKIGDTVRGIKPGYTVEIDPRPYMVREWKDQSNPTLHEQMEKKNVKVIAWPIEEVDGVEVMVVPDSHVRMRWRNGLE
jgi:hypothetical protein